MENAECDRKTTICKQEVEVRQEVNNSYNYYYLQFPPTSCLLPVPLQRPAFISCQFRSYPAFSISLSVFHFHSLQMPGIIDEACKFLKKINVLSEIFTTMGKVFRGVFFANVTTHFKKC